jgi:hypothetical protein
VAVIQISIDDEDYLVSLYLKKKPASATMLLPKDQLKQIQDAYSVNGIPANFLIDRTGMIRHYNAGYGPGLENKLREWIDAALGTAAKK